MKSFRTALATVAATLSLCLAAPQDGGPNTSGDKTNSGASTTSQEVPTDPSSGQEQAKTPAMPVVPPDPPLLDCYDFVVVGAGSAGSVVANRLAADGNYSVLLLEAGGEPTANLYVPLFSFDSANESNSWQYQTVPQTNGCLSFPGRMAPMTQGKLLGGTSGINSMSYVRGNKQDFDSWEKNYSAKGWDYQSVLPFFKEIENFSISGISENRSYHGYQGETPINYPNYYTNLSNYFLNACREAGYENIDYNGEKHYGYSRLQSNTRDGVRMSAYTCFVEGPRYTPNGTLHVSINSTATKITFQGKKATGVVFTKNGENKSVRIGREVIVSAGAIGTPHLLMLSGIGPRAHLDELKIPVVADLPVGDGLQDHVVFLGLVVTTKEDYIGWRTFNETISYLEYLFHKTGLFTLPGAYEALLFTNSKNDTKELQNPDIKLALTSIFPNPKIAMSPYVTPELYKMFYEPLIVQNKTGFMSTITMGQPKSRGCVKLNTSDPSDPPLIDPNILSDESDINRTVEGVLRVKELFEQKAMTSIGAEVYKGEHPNCSFVPWTKEYIKCFLQYSGFPSMHVCCTAAMGNHSRAVVDSRLRVLKGVQGVRVADASVMPHITSGNTHAPVMMIGAKAAKMILEDAKAEEEEQRKKTFRA